MFPDSNEPVEEEPTAFRIEITIRNTDDAGLYKKLSELLEFTLEILKIAGPTVFGAIFKVTKADEEVEEKDA